MCATGTEITFNGFSGICGKLIQFNITSKLSNKGLPMLFSVHIKNDDVSSFTLNTTTHNSTFRPTSETQFGASHNKSYACNSTFPFTHGWDKISFTDVVFQANVVNGVIGEPGLSRMILVVVLVICVIVL